MKNILKATALSILAITTLTGCAQTGKTEEQPVDQHAEKAQQEQQPEQQTEVKFTTYENKEAKVKVDYPENYELIEDTAGILAVFLDQQKDATDVYRDNISVAIQDVSKEQMTLDKFKELTQESLAKNLENYEEVALEETELSGNKAYAITYKAKFKILDIQGYQVFTIKDDKAYVVTGTTEQDEYDNYAPIFKKAVSTFQITE